MSQKVLLVSLGGTITMTSGASAGIVPTLTGEDLIRAVPALSAVAEIEAVSPFRLPSASLSLAQVREVARLLNDRLAGDIISGAVVVQGTDTIEETAFLLDLLVDSDKPVVVLGAMRGAEAPGADGPANLLAGVQIAITEPIRLDDVVVVEGEWGRIEEITFTYVVVRSWDERRVVLPISYFTQTPFENWTRKRAQVMGAVFLHVDYTAPVDELREEVGRIVAETDLWDGREVGLQATDTKDRTLELRIVASAASEEDDSLPWTP